MHSWTVFCVCAHACLCLYMHAGVAQKRNGKRMFYMGTSSTMDRYEC
jgi:hypothetical protein